MATSTMTREKATTQQRTGAGRPFLVLTVLAAVAVLLQGVWAGIFLQHDGARDAAGSWIDVHARGGEVAILFTLLALAYGVFKLRGRRDLLGGAVALLALLVAESYLGGLVRDQGKDTLTAVHIPLGMAIMGVSVWLPLRARHDARADSAGNADNARDAGRS
ncbi:hypothetical protein BH10ACT8_BH10ACT8_02670 [soil metagenome]